MGLFIGVELVRDALTLEPAATEASWVCEQLKECEPVGILLSTDGPFHNVLKFKPPLVINKQDVDYLLQQMRVVLSRLPAHVHT